MHRNTSWPITDRKLDEDTGISMIRSTIRCVDCGYWAEFDLDSFQRSSNWKHENYVYMPPPTYAQRLALQAESMCA